MWTNGIEPANRSLTGCVFGFPVPHDGSRWDGFDGPLPQHLEQLTAS